MAAPEPVADAKPKSLTARAGARAGDVVEAPLQDLVERLAGVKEVQSALKAALQDELSAMAPSPPGAVAEGAAPSLGDASARLKLQTAMASEFEARLRRVQAAVGTLEQKLGRVEAAAAALRSKADARATHARARKEAERARDRDLADVAT